MHRRHASLVNDLILSEDDKSALLEILPRATEVERVTIGRSYQGKTRTVVFPRPEGHFL